MELSDTQIAEYDEQGYLFFPNLLENDEVEILQRAVPEIRSHNRSSKRKTVGNEVSF